MSKIFLKLYYWIGLFFLISCQGFDISNSSQVFNYPKPEIKKLTIKGNQLTITITFGLNPNGRNDFNHYVVFATSTTNSFNRLISLNLNEINLTSTADLPFFITNTNKPTFSTSQVEDYQQIIQLDSNAYSFKQNNNYKFIVMAWGINGQLAISFNNNGWVYSSFSEEQNFHYRLEKKGVILTQYNLLNGDNYGFNFISTNFSLANTTNVSPNYQISTNQIIFFSDNSNNQIFFFTSSGTLIQPLGSQNSFSEVISLSTIDSDYFTTGTPIPINVNNLYAIKNSNDTYAKLYVNSLDVISTATNTINLINLDIAYSIIPNEKRF